MSRSSRNDYKRTLIHLMNYTHNTEYSRDHVFSNAELRQLTPFMILRWFNVKAYGTPVPPHDANPIYARASSIEYYKKAILFFIPDKHSAWNSAQNEGNPTRSPLIHDFIRILKRKEVRGHGAESRTARAITEFEYKNTMGIFAILTTIVLFLMELQV